MLSYLSACSACPQKRTNPPTNAGEENERGRVAGKYNVARSRLAVCAYAPHAYSPDGVVACGDCAAAAAAIIVAAVIVVVVVVVVGTL